MPLVHHHLVLNRGFLTGEKLLSPTERHVLLALLGQHTEKDIAEDLGMNPGTLHNYFTAQCARFGLATRAAPTALWYAFDSYRPLLNST